LKPSFSHFGRKARGWITKTGAFQAPWANLFHSCTQLYTQLYSPVPGVQHERKRRHAREGRKRRWGQERPGRQRRQDVGVPHPPYVGSHSLPAVSVWLHGRNGCCWNGSWNGSWNGCWIGCYTCCQQVNRVLTHNNNVVKIVVSSLTRASLKLWLLTTASSSSPPARTPGG
jgi:hypothetical protein